MQGSEAMGHLPASFNLWLGAYFVGTSRELAVYSFLSLQVQEDLRHEFTSRLWISTKNPEGVGVPHRLL